MIAPGVSSRLLRLSLPAVLIAAAACLGPAASSAEGPTIEAASSGTGFYWRPSTATISPGGAVSFKNTSTVVQHGVVWQSGPETPSCTGVPVNEGKASWSGSCTFAQPGTYAFVCYVHPTEMKGTVTVTTGESPPGGPPGPGEAPPPGGPSGSGGAPESPLSGPASSALNLGRRQHGTSVRGSIALSGAGAGGRLEVTLLARKASLSGAAHRGVARVGHLLRAGVSSGRVPFAVPLNRAARRALRNDVRLPLTVRVVITPLHGVAVTLSREVMLHS